MNYDFIGAMRPSHCLRWIVANRRIIYRMAFPFISRDPAVMGGTPVFTGTRVPVRTLIEHLEAGDSIDEFLEGFPMVKRQDIVAFLEAAAEELVKLPA